MRSLKALGVLVAISKVHPSRNPRLRDGTPLIFRTSCII